jgi:hypothetical protein
MTEQETRQLLSCIFSIADSLDSIRKTLGEINKTISDTRDDKLESQEAIKQMMSEGFKHPLIIPDIPEIPVTELKPKKGKI